MSVIATATNTVVSTIPVGSLPFGVAVTPDGGHVYVTDAGSANVSVVATATNTVIATIPVGPEPIGVAIGTPATVEADLALTKAVDNGTPTVGQNVTFTLTLTNKGPDNATGVTVEDSLPSGLTFVSATPSGTTTYDPATGVWTVGTLDEGATETLDIVATATTPGAHTNTATISHSDQVDTNDANNSASGEVVVEAPPTPTPTPTPTSTPTPTPCPTPTPTPSACAPNRPGQPSVPGLPNTGYE